MNIRDESDGQSHATIDKLLKDAFERPDSAAVKHFLGGTLPKEQVTVPHRKLKGRGLRKQPWLKALKKLARQCRDAFWRNAHANASERDFGSWEDNDSQLLRVSANARQIENAIVSGDVKAVYALAGYGFIQYSEEAFNALRDDSHTAYEPSR